MLFNLHEPQATASKMLTLEAAQQCLIAVQYRSKTGLCLTNAFGKKMEGQSN